MKTIKNKFAVLAALGLLAFTAQATVLPLIQPAQNAFSVSSTNQNSALSWAIIPARSGNGGAPAVQFVNAGQIGSNSVVSFYRVTATCIVKYTNSTVTLFVDNTNGFDTAQSGVIIVRHLVDETYERRILTANSDTTNLVTTVAITGVAVPGDIVYRVTSAGMPNILLGIGNMGATNTFSASAGYLAIGQPGKPLLVDVTGNGATAGSIYDVSGVFLPPPRVDQNL